MDKKMQKILFLLGLLFVVTSQAKLSAITGVPQSVTTTTPKTLQPTAPTEDVSNLTGLSRPSLVTQATAIVFMSLLPFLVMILSSFVKIVVVLSLLRNALGVQQAPPNQVINGIAFLLSIYVMFPTGVKMYDAAKLTVGSGAPPQEIF